MAYTARAVRDKKAAKKLAEASDDDWNAMFENLGEEHQKKKPTLKSCQLINQARSPALMWVKIKTMRRKK